MQNYQSNKSIAKIDRIIHQSKPLFVPCLALLDQNWQF